MSEPTVDELVDKALQAGAIDAVFAEELRASADIGEAIGMFYTYALEAGNDPDALLAEWEITEERQNEET